MISKKKIIPLAVIAAAVIVAVIVVMSFVRGRDDGTMKLSGNVEVTECNVGFKVAGKIRALKVDEGARVKEGDLIAELSSGDVKALVDQNRAALEEARVKLAELKAGSRRQEIVKARADSASLEAELVKARKDFERAGTLYENGAISASRFDAAKSAYETRLGQLKSARQQQSLVEEGPRREDIRAAELRVKQLEALVANTEEKLADTRLYAPISGVVFRKNVELGEIVQPGAAVFTIGDLDRPWVKVYVKEDKLALVKLGQKARITVDTYKDRSYEGTVTFISSDAEFTPKEKQGVFNSLISMQDPVKLGQWADWMGGLEKDPGREHVIGQFIRQWLVLDPHAAKTWLDAQPESPMRTTAAKNYAMNVASKDPLVAAEVALTLPPGNDRSHALAVVRDEWKKKDPAGYLAFAEKQGLKK